MGKQIILTGAQVWSQLGSSLLIVRWKHFSDVAVCVDLQSTMQISSKRNTKTEIKKNDSSYS